MFADIFFHLAALRRKELFEMMMEAAIELRKRGLDQKRDEMELMAWGHGEGKDGGVLSVVARICGAGGQEYEGDEGFDYE